MLVRPGKATHVNAALGESSPDQMSIFALNKPKKIGSVNLLDSGAHQYLVQTSSGIVKPRSCADLPGSVLIGALANVERQSGYGPNTEKV